MICSKCNIRLRPLVKKTRSGKIIDAKNGVWVCVKCNLLSISPAAVEFEKRQRVIAELQKAKQEAQEDLQDIFTDMGSALISTDNPKLKETIERQKLAEQKFNEADRELRNLEKTEKL